MDLVSLTKRQTVSLTKAAGSALSNISIGLGWDPMKKKPKGFFGSIFGGNNSDSIDLDASIVLLDSQCNPLDIIWFNNLHSSCKAVNHRGDNLTGDGDGDDELIDISLNRLPSNVAYLAITVNSFRGQTFNEVDNAFCRVINSANNQEICKYKLAEQGSHTGVLIASLARKDTDWEFKAQGVACRGQTVNDMIPDIKSELV
jgi:tellurium resistance protein TerZ